MDTRRHRQHHGGRGHTNNGGGFRRGRGRGNRGGDGGYSSTTTAGNHSDSIGTMPTTTKKKHKHVSVLFQELILSYLLGPHSSSTNSTTTTTPTVIDSDRSTCLFAVDALAKVLSKRNHMQKLQNRRATATRNANKLMQLVTAARGEPIGSDFRAFIAQVTARKLEDIERNAAAWTSIRAATASAIALPPPPIGAPSLSNDELVFYFTGVSDMRDRVLLHDAMRRYGKALIIADTIPSTDASIGDKDKQLHTHVIRVRRALAPSEQLMRRPLNKKAAAAMRRTGQSQPHARRSVDPSTAAATAGGVTQATGKPTSKIGRPGFSLGKQ